MHEFLCIRNVDAASIQYPCQFKLRGIILFLMAIKMIFQENQNIKNIKSQHHDQVPFIIPIASPLLAGPGMFSTLLFNNKGVNELERFMGLILIMLSIQIFLDDLRNVGKNITSLILALSVSIIINRSIPIPHPDII
ncbi:hypothetical protein GQX74_015766 [Glossina fuscipes]|nr:hypothetical protein GQX74_015766 [Glossina fuscipes]